MHSEYSGGTLEVVIRGEHRRPDVVDKLTGDHTVYHPCIVDTPKHQGHICGSTGKLSKNHLEERLLDQAQARALYTPLFLGVVRVVYPNVWFLTSNPL